MRFGIFTVVDHYPGELARSLPDFYGELLEQAKTADELGFNSFWIAEHHFREYGAVPRPAIFLAALAASTQSIKLGSAVAVLPFDDPLRIAEDFAMLDIISKGRVEFGVGSGYLQHEYAGFSLNPQERRERFDEGLAIILKAWTGERFSFMGKFHQVDNVQLNVLPLQKPAPEIFIAVLRNEVAVFVGRQKKGMMMIPYASTEKISELAETSRAYREAFSAGNAEDGSEKHSPRVQFGLHCFCGRDTETARQFARPYMERYVRTRLYARQRPFDELIEKDLIAVGAPEEIARVARRYEDAGLDDFLMIMNFGGMPHDAVLESMRLIADQVMPCFSEGPGMRTTSGVID